MAWPNSFPDAPQACGGCCVGEGQGFGQQVGVGAEHPGCYVSIQWHYSLVLLNSCHTVKLFNTRPLQALAFECLIAMWHVCVCVGGGGAIV